MKIQQAFQEIKKISSSIKNSDIEFILKFLLKMSKTQLYMSFDENLTQTKQKQLFAIIKRYQSGEPLGYILGKIDFFRRDFLIKKPVLIPRIDSEVLVTECLKLIKKHSLKSLLEIGSGSGNLSISLASSSKVEITALELSADAIFLSKKNLKLHKTALEEIGSQILFKKTNILNEKAPKKPYEMIFSNPPYVSDSEMNKLPSEIKNWEDKLALWGGVDGLKFYYYFAKELQKWLVVNGWLVLEHGYQQKEKIIHLFKKQGWIFYSSCQDLGNRNRVLVFRLPKSIKSIVSGLLSN